MSTIGPLRGGASDIDTADPATIERAERRAATAEAQRDYERAMDAHLGRSPTLRDRDGMRCAPHPNDAAPRPPALPVDELDAELDPTGRRRYDADTSAHVSVTLTCTAPGCAVTAPWIGREDTLQRTRQAGGPRCADHPLELDADEQTPTPRPRALGA